MQSLHVVSFTFNRVEVQSKLFVWTWNANDGDKRQGIFIACIESNQKLFAVFLFYL